MPHSRRKKQNRLLRLLRVVFYRRRLPLVVSIIMAGVMAWGVVHFSWEVPQVPVPAPRSWTQIRESDTLCVVTLPTSFAAFRYRDTWMGHEYENAREVAQALGLKLKVLLVDNEQAMVDSLYTGAADVLIYPMPYQKVDEHWFLRPTGPRWAESECLVSMHPVDSVRIDSLLALLPHDSLNVEQLTDSMVAGKYEVMRLRCNVARLMHDYYPKLMVMDTLPNTQDSMAWMVSAGADTLRRLIDSVSTERLEPGTPFYTIARSRYGDHRRKRTRRVVHYVKREGGLSAYDDIFRAKGTAYDLDWRLLAGIAFVESNFNHAVVSNKGPLGLMQLMPQTVRSYNFTEEDALEPENNVEMAARLFCSICTMVRNRVPNISDDDLLCFALTGYNAGVGHLFDAIRLAETLGYKPHVWPDNVEHCLRLKHDARYYRMEVVKCGQFNGAFTVNYVNEVMAAYHTFCAQVEKD